MKYRHAVAVRASVYKIYENYYKDGKIYFTVYNANGFLVLLTRQASEINKYKDR
jgi:hypothetical protein